MNSSSTTARKLGSVKASKRPILPPLTHALSESNNVYFQDHQLRVTGDAVHTSLRWGEDHSTRGSTSRPMLSRLDSGSKICEELQIKESYHKNKLGSLYKSIEQLKSEVKAKEEEYNGIQAKFQVMIKTSCGRLLSYDVCDKFGECDDVSDVDGDLDLLDQPPPPKRRLIQADIHTPGSWKEGGDHRKSLLQTKRRNRCVVLDDSAIEKEQAAPGSWKEGGDHRKSLLQTKRRNRCVVLDDSAIEKEQAAPDPVVKTKEKRSATKGVKASQKKATVTLQKTAAFVKDRAYPPGYHNGRDVSLGDIYDYDFQEGESLESVKMKALDGIAELTELKRQQDALKLAQKEQSGLQLTESSDPPQTPCPLLGLQQPSDIYDATHPPSTSLADSPAVQPPVAETEQRDAAQLSLADTNNQPYTQAASITLQQHPFTSPGPRQCTDVNKSSQLTPKVRTNPFVLMDNAEYVYDSDASEFASSILRNMSPTVENSMDSSSLESDPFQMCLGCACLQTTVDLLDTTIRELTNRLAQLEERMGRAPPLPTLPEAHTAEDYIDSEETDETGRRTKVTLKQDIVDECMEVVEHGREFIARQLVRKLFSKEVRQISNCGGRSGKWPLDPVLLQAIQDVVFQNWQLYVSPIDAMNRDIKRRDK